MMQQGPGDGGQIMRCRAIALTGRCVIEAVHVDDTCGIEPQLGCLGVHQSHEAIDGTADMLGDGGARVIGRAYDDRRHQFTQGKDLALSEKDL